MNKSDSQGFIFKECGVWDGLLWTLRCIRDSVDKAKSNLGINHMPTIMSDKEESEKILSLMSGIEALDYRTSLILLLLIVLLGINIAFMIWTLIAPSL